MSTELYTVWLWDSHYRDYAIFGGAFELREYAELFMQTLGERCKLYVMPRGS